MVLISLTAVRGWLLGIFGPDPGSLDSPERLIDELEETLEEIAYAAPEQVESRRAAILESCRRQIRDYHDRKAFR